MKILQRLLFQGNKEILIDEENGRVKIKHLLFGRSNSNSFTLRELDSEFENFTNKAYKPLFILVILFLVTFRLIYESYLSGNANSAWLSIIFLPFLFSSGYYYLKGKAQFTVVKKRMTGEVAFTIWNNAPSKIEFENFIKALKSKVNEVQNPKPTSFNEKLNEYKCCLEYLIEAEVMTKDEGVMIFNRYKNEHEQAKVYPINFNSE
jgi:hypothetical protein